VSTPDIRARLDRYVCDVLALPHAEQLADLSVFEIAVEMGRHLERADLGIASRPRPSRPVTSRHLAVVREGTP
jgi:hypothetical protein